MKRPKNDEKLAARLLEVHQLITARKGTEAIEAAEAMMRESPDDPLGYFLLGLYAFSQSNFGDAIELFNAAHDRDPDCREYSDCLAILYTVTGKLSDGLYFAKLSTALDSDPHVRPFIPRQLSNYFEALDRIQPSPHYVNAMLLFNARRLDDAVRRCELEIKQNERNGDCYTVLGKCHLLLGNYAKAASALHAAIHLDPANAENVGVLATALCHLGRFEEAMVCHKQALERQPESIAWSTAANLDAEFLPDEMEPVRAGLRAGLAERIAKQPASEIQIDRERTSKSRIRVGYLSNAFYNTEQARFILPLLQNHDRNRFEIFCYQQSIAEDSVTVSLQNHADSWRKVFDVQDTVFDLIINGDNIDILVDLCGNTWDNRAGLIARHPAPMQMAWLEPPFGIRTAGIDVVLSDPITHDTDVEVVGKEQGIVSVDTGLLALDPFTMLPAINALPAGAEGRLTFGGHCDLARLTPGTAALWSRVLGATGRSKLLLGNAGTIAGEIKNHVVDLFGHFGMADRIIFWDVPEEDHQKIEFFRQIDVLLDTHPVNSRLDICKALWMGVPALSLSGRRRVSQVGASLLHAAGQDRWICRSADEMVARAAEFAEDLDGLAAIRSSLRDDVKDSDLFSPKRVVAALEAIYGAAVELTRHKDDIAIQMKVAAEPGRRRIAGGRAKRKAAGDKKAARRAPRKKAAARSRRRRKATRRRR